MNKEKNKPKREKDYVKMKLDIFYDSVILGKKNKELRKKYNLNNRGMVLYYQKRGRKIFGEIKDHPIFNWYSGKK